MQNTSVMVLLSEETITNTIEDNILINDGSLERPTSLDAKKS